MKPRSVKRLGLYVMVSFALIITTGLAHSWPFRFLEQKAFANGFKLSV